MSVATVKTRLAAIQETISGVKRAYAQPPLSLPASDLPAMVNFAGAATHEWRVAGNDVDLETRAYLMRLYVAPLTTGVPGEMERLCEPFFVSVRDMFAARPGLGLGTKGSHLTGVQLAILQGDSGVSVMTYGGAQYVGVEFRLQVTELVEVNYADYD